MGEYPSCFDFPGGHPEPKHVKGFEGNAEVRVLSSSSSSSSDDDDDASLLLSSSISSSPLLEGNRGVRLLSSSLEGKGGVKLLFLPLRAPLTGRDGALISLVTPTMRRVVRDDTTTPFLFDLVFLVIVVFTGLLLRLLERRLEGEASCLL